MAFAGQVVNSLYGMEMRHSAEVAALELLVTLKKMNVGLMDLAKALKKMQNLHALSLLFPPGLLSRRTENSTF